MLDEMFSRLCVSIAALFASAITLVATSRKRPHALISVAATVVEVRAADLVEMLVDAEAIETRAFLVVFWLLTTAVHF